MAAAATTNGAIETSDLAAQHFFARIPEHIDAVRFYNLEAAPESAELRGGSGDYFREISLFKVNPSSFGSRFHSFVRKFWPKGRPYFTAYKNGKTAVRCHRDIIPKGSHGFERTDPTRLLVSVDSSQLHISGRKYMPPQVLHFPHSSFTLWRRKYMVLGDFPDVWCGSEVIPKESFHIKSRDTVCCICSSAEEDVSRSLDKARELFVSAMVFQDKEVKARLLERGILVRYTDVAKILSSFT